MTRRGLELFLARFPERPVPKTDWFLPKVRGGGLMVPLDKLRDIAAHAEHL